MTKKRLLIAISLHEEIEALKSVRESLIKRVETATTCATEPKTPYESAAIMIKKRIKGIVEEEIDKELKILQKKFNDL